MCSLHLEWILLGILRNMTRPQFLLLLIRNKKPLFLKWGFSASQMACVHIIDTAEGVTGFENFHTVQSALFVTDGEQRHGEKWGLAQTCCVSASSRKPYSILLVLFSFLEESHRIKSSCPPCTCHSSLPFPNMST